MTSPVMAIKLLQKLAAGSTSDSEDEESSDEEDVTDQLKTALRRAGVSIRMTHAAVEQEWCDSRT